MKLADLQVDQLSEFTYDFDTQSYFFWSRFNASKIYCNYRVTSYAKSNSYQDFFSLQNPNQNNMVQTQWELNTKL